MRVIFAAVGSEIISIEALSSVLKAYGHQCGLAFDRAMFDDKQYFTVPFLARIFDDSKQVVKDILEYKPDLLAFSVFADNFQWCLNIAREVKKNMDVPVIMGGVHPTSVPEVCIREDCVDMICCGEGEYPLLELLESMEGGKSDYSIKNLWFKRNGQIIKNAVRPLIQNLDELPLIDKSLFEKFIPLSEYYLTVTNRGCIAACSYCSQNFYAAWERDNRISPFYRERSVESVIQELKFMKARYNFKRVDIKNNVLSASKLWTFEFTKRYKKEIGVPFRVMGHPKTIDCEVAKVLKDAGCWHVQIGVESLNPQIRKVWLKRNETNEDIRLALEAMDSVDLNYSVDLMVGLPGESDSDIRGALEFFSGRKNLVRASIFWLKYLPSVEITQAALTHNYIGLDDLHKINQGLQPNYLSTGSVENKEIRERLLNFQLLFRILPIAPGWFIRFTLRKGYYKYFKYLPQVPIIIISDIIVSIIRRDHWAIYAIYSYLWEIGRRIKRLFRRQKIRGNYKASKLVKEINRIYHEIEAQDYDSRHPEIIEGDVKWWRALGEKFIKPLSKSKNISLLDVGSGTGFVGNISLEYTKSKDMFVCYDLSYNMLNKAREKLKNSFPDKKEFFLNGDAELLPFKDGSFNIITINAVIHHLPNYKSLLGEIDRILRKGGILVVAHEQSSDFFKSKIFFMMALFYKLIGGRMEISDSMLAKVNLKAREEGLIENNLSKSEVMKLVDYHSPIEQGSVFIDKNKGIPPREILSSCFSNYRILELRQYSTFFHRPFLEKNRIFQFCLKILNDIILRKRGPLFSFIIEKPEG